MKLATLYAYRDALYVHGMSQTEDGFWIITPPVLTPAMNSLEAVGRDVKLCLGASRQGIGRPASRENLFAPVLKASRARSVTAFNKDAKCVEIEQRTGAAIKVLATENLGPSEGFTTNGYDQTLDQPLDGELASAIMLALSKCT